MSFAGISTGYDSEGIFKERDEQMCNRWTRNTTQLSGCNMTTYNNPYGTYVIDVKLNGNLRSQAGSSAFMKFWAAAPAISNSSFYGSGMPFATEVQAMQNSPNVGAVRMNNGAARFNIRYPSSYYVNMGKKLVPPTINFQVCDGNAASIGKVYSVVLGNPIPFRTLTWPIQRKWSDGPLFYCNNNLPVLTQEQILYNSSYPCTNNMPRNFWGLKPPC
jgi:hypothetical protein